MRKCIYCGSEIDLHKEHIVPKSLGIREECTSCDTIQGIHNQIWACGNNPPDKPVGFRIGRNWLGKPHPTYMYQFFKDKFPTEHNFYDLIPPLLEKKYLKTIYNGVSHF